MNKRRRFVPLRGTPAQPPAEGAAVEAVLEEHAKPPLTVKLCRLRAWKDKVFYEVEMTAPHNYASDHDRNFTQKVDFYTGEPMELSVCR